jgi:hypothetical protein
VVGRELRTATVRPIGEDHRGGIQGVVIAAGVEHGSQRLGSIRWVVGLTAVIGFRRWTVTTKAR